MGVVRTDRWLEEHLQQPLELCKQARPGIEEPSRFYRYLQSFGMYQPSRASESQFKQLKEQLIWEEIEKYFIKYKRLWNGPDIRIFIFPIHPAKGIDGKAGISFLDEMYLFISPQSDAKNRESLFVHEYHHVTRMKKLNKNEKDYSLLDSIVLEGLAENAVHEYCGERYVGKWTKYFQQRHLKHYWKHTFEPNLTVNRENRVHDDLLFGKRGLPRMLGYAIGYELIQGYKAKNTLTMNETFTIPSSHFLKNNRFIND